MSKVSWPLPGQTTKIETPSIKKVSSKLNDEARFNKQSKLLELRSEIDSIDDQLTSLLLKRFDLASQIAEEKIHIGCQLKDELRESEVRKRLSKQTEGHASARFISGIFDAILKESVQFQRTIPANKESTASSRNLFPTVCIIGVGLIGGAFARKIKKTFPSTQVHAIDLPQNADCLKESQLFDSVNVEINAESINKCSLLILACPAQVNLSVLTKLAPLLEPGQIVIDLSSTKTSICMLAERTDLNDAEFFGAHPFFGSEKKGFESSIELDPAGHTICIVQGAKSSDLSFARLRHWFQALQMKVVQTNAREHDKTVAFTSHLIQLFSSALGTCLFEELAKTDRVHELQLSGPALSGLSRLMGSPAELWKEISIENKSHITEAIEKVSSKMLSMTRSQAMQAEGDFERIFAEAALIKEKIESQSAS